MYHGYICQYKDVLKQYQLKYLETPLSHEYYEKKREYEEIKNRVLTSTEQLKMNETIFMEFLGNNFLYILFDTYIFLIHTVLITLPFSENNIINQYGFVFQCLLPFHHLPVGHYICIHSSIST